MSYLEESLRHFITNMKSDISITEQHLGDDPRMAAVASAQKAFVAELEDLVNDACEFDYEEATDEVDMAWDE